MAPISHEPKLFKKTKSGNLIRKQNFKKVQVKSTSCISNLLNKVKEISKTFLWKDKFVESWNFLAELFSNCSEEIKDNSEINNPHLDEIYNNLIKYIGTLENTKSNNSFVPCIQHEEKRTARSYAANLWSWNKKSRIKSNNMWSIKKFIEMSFSRMSSKDIDFIQSIIINYYEAYFPSIDCNTEEKTVIDDILSKLREFEKYATVLIGIIHIWFLTMPILKELNKYMDWVYLKKMNAFLLDVDKLYSILLLIIYGGNEEK